MDLTSAWRAAFQGWPASFPKAGIVVTSMEAIPFVDFLIGESFVILERDRPDAQGARKLIIALSAILAVKLSTPDALSTLSGFSQPQAAGPDDFGGTTSLGSRAAAAARRTSDFGRKLP